MDVSYRSSPWTLINTHIEPVLKVVERPEAPEGWFDRSTFSFFMTPKSSLLCLSSPRSSPGYEGLKLGQNLAHHLITDSQNRNEWPEKFSLAFEGYWHELLSIPEAQEGFLVGLLGRSLSCPPINIYCPFLKEHQSAESQSLVSHLWLGRDLIQTPSNKKAPPLYLKWIKAFFAEDTRIEMDIYSAQELWEKNLQLTKAVGGEDAVLVVLKNFQKNSGSPLVLIGKGVTFDTGGVCIKPAQPMRLMKKDMGGSAITLAFFKWLIDRSPIPIVAYLPIAENNLRPDSFRPGDVYQCGAFQVEIDHTDAEGRLILADAIEMAKQENPIGIWTIATLTGAARIALGDEIDAAYTNQKNWVQLIDEASEKTGDWVWRLPLYPPYKRHLESENAHFVNTSPFKAGSIEAALFLQHFIGEIPWLHLDIYAWSEGRHALGKGSGPTAKPFRFLWALFQSLYLS